MKPSLLPSFVKKIKLTKTDTTVITVTIMICFTILLASKLKSNEIRSLLLSDGSAEIKILYLCADN